MARRSDASRSDASRSGPEPVKIHRSLIERTYIAGVGLVVLVTLSMLVWICFAIFGLFSPVTLGTLLFAAVMIFMVRFARQNDSYAVELFLREAATPNRLEPQAAPCEASPKPPSAIPSNP